MAPLPVVAIGSDTYVKHLRGHAIWKAEPRAYYYCTPSREIARMHSNECKSGGNCDCRH